MMEFRSSAQRSTNVNCRSARTQGGFSMIEMLIVVAIVLIVAGIAIPKFSSVQTYRGQNDARAIIGQLMTARMRATADFGRAKVRCTVNTNSCVISTQRNGDGANSWTPEPNGGTLILSTGVSLAIPPAATTGAGNQSVGSATQGSSQVTPPTGMIEITYNSRGLPVSPGNYVSGTGYGVIPGTSLVPDYAIYLTNSTQNTSFAVALDASGRASVYRLDGSTYTLVSD